LSTPETQVLRDVAEAVRQVRHAMAHGDVLAARDWARRLVEALERVPAERAAYEALCEAADRELAANPNAWDRREEPGRS
jgi:hypothetical protein